MTEPHLPPVNAGLSAGRETIPDSQSAACPPPLAWQEVLAQFREQSQPWTLERNGRVLRGRSWGAGIPLYFVNGFSGSFELYALSIWLLRNEFRCVAIDYAAPRQTSSVAKGYTLDEFTADLFAVADSQADDSFCLFATSFGALVALSAMLDQPERIERAVIQNGFAYRKLTMCEKALISLSVRLPCRLRYVPFRTYIQKQNHRLWFPPFDFNRFKFFLDDTGAVPIANMASLARNLLKLDLRPRLSEIKNEILLIRTEGEGCVASGCMQTLQDTLINAQSESLHTSGQLPFLTHPHRLAKSVRGFLMGSCEAVIEQSLNS